MLIKIAGKDFASAMEDLRRLKPISLSFSVKGDTLTLASSGSMQYIKDIRILESVDKIETVMCVLYTDVSSLIKSRDTVSISFDYMQLDFKVGGYNFSFPISEEVVTIQRPPEMQHEDFGDTDSLCKTLRGKAVVSLFQKELQREPVLCCTESRCYVTFPTVWAYYPQSCLECALTAEQAKTIAWFEPESFIHTDALYLFKGTATLVVQAEHVKGDIPKDFVEKWKTLDRKCTLDMSGTLTSAKKLLSCLGDSECVVYVTDEGLFFHVSKGNISLKEEITGELKYSFETRLSYMVAILQDLGNYGNTEVFGDADLVLFHKYDTVIMLSVRR